MGFDVFGPLTQRQANEAVLDSMRTQTPTVLTESTKGLQHKQMSAPRFRAHVTVLWSPVEVDVWLCSRLLVVRLNRGFQSAPMVEHASLAIRKDVNLLVVSIGFSVRAFFSIGVPAVVASDNFRLVMVELPWYDLVSACDVILVCFATAVSKRPASLEQ